MSQFAWTFPGGKLKQVVTSIVLVNNTEKTQDVSVPAGKIWKLLSIKTANGDDVDRAILMRVFMEVAKTNKMFDLTYAATVSAGADIVWPHGKTGSQNHVAGWNDVILAAANTISIVWSAGGASTGATDADGLVVTYLEIDAP